MPSNLPELPHFAIVRTDLLAKLDRALARHGVVSLVSAADQSSGKTMAAVQFGHRHAGAFPGGQFVVRCVNSSVISGMVALAPTFGVSPMLKDDVRAVQVARRLSADGRALLILDDVPSVQWWNECSFRREMDENVKVVLTTTAALPDDSSRIDVPQFSETESAELLNADANGVRALAAVLRGEPAAILVARAIFQRDPAQSATVMGSRITHQPDPFGAILTELEEFLDDIERRILDYAAFLPHGQIHRRWIVDLLVRDKGLPTAPGMRAEPAEADAIDRLIGLGLLFPVDARATVLEMSRPLVSRRLRQIERQPALQKNLGNGLLRFLGDRRAALAKWKENPFLRDEVGALCAMIRRLAAQSAPKTALALAIGLADMLQALHRYEESAANFVPLLESGTFEQCPPAGQVRALSALSFVYRHQKKDAEANRFLERAGEIARREKGEHSDAFAWVLHSQSLLLADQKRFAEAEAMMWQAMAIRRAHCSSEDKSFWAHHAILAKILADQNKFSQAAEQVRQALAISQIAGRTEEQIASDYSLLAIYLTNAGDFRAAEAESLRCVELSEAVFPSNHPTLATRIVLHSKLLQKMKKWSDARAWLERGIALKLKLLPADDPSMAAQYNNLSLICKALGDPAEAIAQMAKAIEINRRHLDSKDPRLATNYHNLSTIYEQSGDVVSALRWNLEATPIIAQFPTTDALRTTIERSRATLQRRAARLAK